MAQGTGAPTPPHRICGAMQVHNRLLEQYPDFRRRLGDLEHSTRARLSQQAVFRAAPRIITIPVVVHVVHQTAAQNIGKPQIDSQIAALNRDYSAANPDRNTVPAAWAGLVTDTDIQFALATRDPAGQPHEGITRTQTNHGAFDTHDDVKSNASGGADAWPSDRYLNLWVCELSDGVLGYAQFPGGPAATDGVVITYTAFGTSGTAAAPFNMGRTATHEVGHWLNLRHIWGDIEDCTGNDLVDDTPNAQHPNFGRPAFPHVSCGNGPNGDMFVNYMDYVDDAAMVMFTAGQVVRMHAALEGERSALLAAATS
jgi:hypothetical protein